MEPLVLRPQLRVLRQKAFQTLFGVQMHGAELDAVEWVAIAADTGRKVKRRASGVGADKGGDDQQRNTEYGQENRRTCEVDGPLDCPVRARGQLVVSLKSQRRSQLGGHDGIGGQPS